MATETVTGFRHNTVFMADNGNGMPSVDVLLSKTGSGSRSYAINDRQVSACTRKEGEPCR
ncbi:MAG: hypothetical protein B0D91_10765 [Oceanospirillales bacterium LUC14_002_19_P2]|nr:MAG: hypothetical protein B0D91_10765 [Oceanospirillales bacterium LUC14_002_19_P2]